MLLMRWATSRLWAPFTCQFRRIARWTLMGYAALTIGAYLAFGLVRHEWTMALGPVDKLIEVTLIALLWPEDQFTKRSMVRKRLASSIGPFDCERLAEDRRQGRVYKAGARGHLVSSDNQDY
jgi:hypothetical protein